MTSERPETGFDCARRICCWLDGQYQQKALTEIDRAERRWQDWRDHCELDLPEVQA